MFAIILSAYIVKSQRLSDLIIKWCICPVNRLESMVFWQILGAIAAGVPYAAVKKMDLLDAWRLAGDAKELFFES